VTVNVTVVPPTQPHVELSVSGLKNFQCQQGGFVAQLTVSELKELWGTITTKLQEAGVPITTTPLP
jgi:hypothetical protein